MNKTLFNRTLDRLNKLQKSDTYAPLTEKHLLDTVKYLESIDRKNDLPIKFLKGVKSALKTASLMPSSDDRYVVLKFDKFNWRMLPQLGKIKYQFAIKWQVEFKTIVNEFQVPVRLEMVLKNDNKEMYYQALRDAEKQVALILDAEKNNVEIDA